MKAHEFRPEIEGLRAIAVLFVFFNHLQIPFFQGGFIGVDVFFVISGFLITMIIKKEIESKTFTVTNFYKKRITRIAPAYFTVLFFTSVITLFILTPYELISYFKSALSSIFFIANFYFWKTAGGYFSDNSQELFLLHFWSLSVEEQFYLIWPLFLLLLFKSIRNIKAITVILVLIIILGAFLSEFVSLRYSSISYFFPVTRAYELILGALLVFVPRIKLHKYISDLLYFSSFSILIYCALYFNEKTVFPGYSALAPCLATATIIYLNSKDSIFFKFLCVRPMSFFGKISYPLYLWHWPLIVVFNISLIKINIPIGLLIFTSAVLLSYLTYIYVEKPAQSYFRNVNQVRTFSYGYIFPTAFFSVITLGIINFNGIPQRFNDQLNQASYALTTYPSRIRSQCHSSKNGFDPENCVLGDTKAESSFIIVGDSIANHFTPMIDIFAKDAGVKGHDYTKDRTAFLPYTKLYNENGIEDKDFIKRNNEIISIIQSGKYRNIIISGGYYSIFNNTEKYSSTKNINGFNSAESGLFNAIELIIKSGSNPIIIYPTPSIGSLNNKCAIKREVFKLDIGCEIPIANLQNQAQSFNKFMVKVKKIYPQIRVIDATKATCDKEVCLSSINSTPIYLDKSHLNYIGAELLAKKYLSLFKNPLK